MQRELIIVRYEQADTWYQHVVLGAFLLTFSQCAEELHSEHLHAFLINASVGLFPKSPHNYCLSMKTFDGMKSGHCYSQCITFIILLLRLLLIINYSD